VSLRRPRTAGLVALIGLLVTFAVMIAADASGTLGTIAFAPWVAIVGVDVGIVAGIAAGGLAGGLWLVAADAGSGSPSVSQAVIRFVVLAVLGGGSGFVGNQLRASERARSLTVSRQRALIDATLDGICLTDVEGNVLIANEPLVRMAVDLGMPTEGTAVERLLHISDKLADPDRYRQRMLEIAASPDQETTDEFELRGTGRVFRGYTSPVRDRRGGFVGRIWTLREVTADKELERMRDAFVATVSHELRTPLTSISGFLEMLEDEQEHLGESGRLYLDVMRRSTDRLHQLVEDLLLVAQIEAQRVDLENEPVRLAAVAEESVAGVRPWALEKKVRLELDADPAPETLGDKRRLGQVLDNLLSNAIKFSNEGGAVTVEVRGGGDTATIVVSDTGIGIPVDEQDHVFSRFYRTRSATELALPGTGLGLAITRALVDQHGGTIELESVEGEGTRVTVTLPAA
jgi:signal transduction histidine kinase